MSSASFFISPQKLWSRIGTGDAPVILDVCRAPIHDAMAGLIPTSTWRQPEAHEEWVKQIDGSRPIVLACRYGHNLSQMVAAGAKPEGPLPPEAPAIPIGEAPTPQPTYVVPEPRHGNGDGPV